MAGWGYFYVCICSPGASEGRFRARLLHPISLNTMTLIGCLGITSTALYFLIRIYLGLKTVFGEYKRVCELLQKHSQEWRRNPSSDQHQSNLLLLASEAQPLIVEGRNLISVFRLTSIAWFIIAGLMAVFHLAAIIPLLRLMRSTLTLTNPRGAWNSHSVFESQKLPGRKQKKWTNAQLAQGYQRLVFQCILIATVQILCMGIALTFYFCVLKYSEPKWRSAAPFLEMGPTSLITPIILIQALTSITSRQKTPIPNFSKVSCPNLEHISVTRPREGLERKRTLKHEGSDSDIAGDEELSPMEDLSSSSHVQPKASDSSGDAIDSCDADSDCNN